MILTIINIILLIILAIEKNYRDTWINTPSHLNNNNTNEGMKISSHNLIY